MHGFGLRSAYCLLPTASTSGAAQPRGRERRPGGRAAAGLVWLIANFSGILLILFIAVLLAVAISPLVGWLEARRVPRLVAIVLIYISLFCVVSLAFGILVPVFVDETGQLSASLPGLLQSVLGLPERWILPYFPSLGQTLRVNDVAQQLSDQIGAVVGGAGALLVGLGRTLTSIILNGLLVLVVGFILTSDAQFAPRFIARFFPPRYRPTAATLARWASCWRSSARARCASSAGWSPSRCCSTRWSNISWANDQRPATKRRRLTRPQIVGRWSSVLRPPSPETCWSRSS